MVIEDGKQLFPDSQRAMDLKRRFRLGAWRALAEKSGKGTVASRLVVMLGFGCWLGPGLRDPLVGGGSTQLGQGVLNVLSSRKEAPCIAESERRKTGLSAS